MTQSRRAFLAAGATGALALSAGCLDFVLGDGPLEFEAEQAAPTDDALEETAFEEHEIRQETLEETVEAGGVERDVEATYWISSYTRQFEIRGETEDGAAFAAVSTPDASVMGRSFNPIADMDNHELLDEFGGGTSDEYDVGDLEHGETTSLSILDEERDVDLFVGSREYEGEPVEAEVLVASFTHEDNYLVVIGTYPRIDTLREAIEKVAEEEAREEADEEFDDETAEEVDEEIDDETKKEARTEAAEEIDAELPEDIDEDVETLFESVEHPY